MKMLSLSKTARILATLMCIISIVTSVIFFPVTGISAAEDIPGTDRGDVSTVSDIPGTDTMDEFTPAFTLAHARGSVKVTNSALKKATADIKIKIGTSKLSKKAFTVKARIDKEKTELTYIPVKAVVKKLGGIYKKSGNKVTVKYEVGSLSSELTFKIGKESVVKLHKSEGGFSVLCRK